MRDQMQINLQYVLLFHHLRRFLEAAAGERIDVVLLKGADLLSSVYPAEEDRGALADFDVLVRVADYERAGKLLEELGFGRAARKDAAVDPYERAYQLHLDEHRYLSFEVHRYLFEPVRYPLDHAGIWRRCRESELEGARCLRLDPCDNFVYLSLHAAFHRLQNLGRAMRDLELLLRHGGVDLDVVAARARQWRATRAVWLFARLLGASHPELDLGRLERELAPPRTARLLSHLVVPGGSARTRVSGLHHQVQAALVWPWLLDSPPQVLRFVATQPSLRLAARKLFG